MNMDPDENLLQQPQASHTPPAHQPPLPQKCPRCDSFNTKFCYYNNYSLSQPRYFCKACRRYWTQGGTLRNVPVGGGCRKSKRPRTSSSSLSNTLTARSTQGLSPPVRPQNLTGFISGQPSRPMPPPMGNPFYTGGSFLSSLHAMQSLPAAGINQGAVVNLGGGGGQFGANMALLQGMSLPSMRSPPPPHQFQPPTTHHFPAQPSLIPPGPFSSWTQGVTNSGGAPSSYAATSNFWSCNSAAAAGNDQAGSSFPPNQWSDSTPGFNPSQ